MERDLTPKTKRGEETRRRILEAAEDLFAEKGYYGTQINDITKMAGIAAGTFYVYFPDKISIFRYLIESLGHELRSNIRTATKDMTSSIEIERQGIREFFRFLHHHIGLFKIVWAAQFVDMDAFKDYYERFAAGYGKSISRAKERHDIRDMDPVLLTYCLMGIYNFVALKYFVFDRREPDACNHR